MRGHPGKCIICGKKESKACYPWVGHIVVPEFVCRGCYLWQMAIVIRHEEQKWKISGR